MAKEMYVHFYIAVVQAFQGFITLLSEIKI